MEVPLWVLTAVVGLLAWRLVCLWVERKSWPPGPLPWPVFGSLFKLGALPHRSLAKLAADYGPIMFLKLGSRPTIIISSSQLAEEVLKNQDVTWSAHSPSIVGNFMFYDSKDMVFGPRWKLHRAVMTRELLTIKRLSDFRTVREEELARGIRRAIEECSSGTKGLKIGSLLRTVSMNIVMRMLMNETLRENSYEISPDFVETLNECLHLMGQFHLGDCVPWLAKVDIQGYHKRMRAVASRMDHFFQKVLEDRRRKLQEKTKSDGEQANKIPDAIDIILKMSNADEKSLEDFEIKSIIQDFLLGGTDTTPGSLEWALTELLKNPATMAKLQAELDSVVGRERLVNESDLPSLPYLEAVMKETMRLHAIAPLLIPHENIKDCVVGGYNIPKGTQLYVNVFAIHRDPKVWERAEEFDPSRFLEGNVQVQDFELLTFGAGRRVCPGKAMGMLVFQYALAVLMQTCEWRLPGSLKPHDIDVEEVFGLAVARLNPLEVVVSPRLPDHVFRTSS